MGRPGCVTSCDLGSGVARPGRAVGAGLRNVPSSPEVLGVLGQIRIRPCFDLTIPPQPNVPEPDDLVQSNASLDGMPHREHPFPPGGGPVLPDQPAAGLLGMPTIAPFGAGHCCMPYPSAFRTAFASSDLVLPPVDGPALRSACRASRAADGRPFHVPCSRSLCGRHEDVHGHLGWDLNAGGSPVPCRDVRALQPGRTCHPARVTSFA